MVSALAQPVAPSIATFGGTTQYAVTWLIQVTGNPLAPAWYLDRGSDHRSFGHLRHARIGAAQDRMKSIEKLSQRNDMPYRKVFSAAARSEFRSLRWNGRWLKGTNRL